jgi:alpha-tubulin suppressor-like RCC1 family protein
VKADGTVWCWGGNMYGESGPQAGAGGSTTPSQVVSVGGGVLDVTADEHTCVTKSDGSVWCWGECEEGQCGSTLDETAAPAAVVGASNATVIIAGDWNTCILTAAATMECWGDDSSGQLGNGMYTYQPATSPLLVPLTCP